MLEGRNERQTAYGTLLDGRNWHRTIRQTTTFASVDSDGNYNFSDFTDHSFLMQYTGDATTAVMTITVAADKATLLATTLAGDETDGSVNLAINLTLIDRVQDLVTLINAQTGYSASLSTSINRHEFGGDYVEWLTAVAGQDIKTAVYETFVDGGEGGSFTIGIPIGFIGVVSLLSVYNITSIGSSLTAYWIPGPGETEQISHWTRTFPRNQSLTHETLAVLRGPIPAGSAIRFKADPNATTDDIEVGIIISMIPINQTGNTGWRAPQDK